MWHNRSRQGSLLVRFAQVDDLLRALCLLELLCKCWRAALSLCICSGLRNAVKDKIHELLNFWQREWIRRLVKYLEKKDIDRIIEAATSDLDQWVHADQIWELWEDEDNIASTQVRFLFFLPFALTYSSISARTGTYLKLLMLVNCTA